MATRKFALHTKPHIAEIGDDITFEFQPEVMGDQYLDQYEAMKERLAAVGLVGGTEESQDVESLREAIAATRDFLAGLMLPESAERFGATPLPNRVVTGLFEWTMELYGGGERPTGSSSASSTPSARAGTRGTANSRSKASTRARGR
ncbi:hypothetical protein OG896_24465 [Streptomyces sp. NBC_00669]|uniref:hypothetical protein n=1 Tax=Streptomyces sp. NBC_00669 TaxID=2976011 RepID=UPI002E2FC01C|nr:hypothetical protein [Streptomyces sp. NBC_00669]